MNLQHGLFIVVHAHFAVIFIVFFMFEKSDPLRISVKAAVENNELRYRYTANVLLHASPSADEDDVLVGDLVR